jgi:hypothetical protein
MEVVEEDGLPNQTAAPFNPLNPLTSLFRAAEEEEDEEDAPLPTAALSGVAAAGGAAGTANGGVGGGIAGDDLQGSTTGVNGFVSSQDFTDAYAAVTSDPWDIYSWCIYLDEAERGHSGSITVEDAYGKFLAQFPRGYKFWNKEIQYFLQRNEFATCDALFNKCLAKCRYVDVWCTYIEMVKRKASVSDGTVVKTQSQITTEKQQLEAAYEKALETVGMSVNSGVIWRDYIDYIRNWPELGNNIEAGNELVWCNRKIVCIGIMVFVSVCMCRPKTVGTPETVSTCTMCSDRWIGFILEGIRGAGALRGRDVGRADVARIQREVPSRCGRVQGPHPVSHCDRL